MAQLNSLQTSGSFSIPITPRSGSSSIGYMWFNTSTKKIQYGFNGSAWSSGGNMINSRRCHAGAGDSSSSTFTVGYNNLTENYNGTSWSSSGNYPSGTKCFIAAAGTQNAGLAFGGGSGNYATGATNEYDGSSWASGGSMGSSMCLYGTGTQNAALVFGGLYKVVGPSNPRYPYLPTPVSTNYNCQTCEYNGSSWTYTTNTPTSTFSGGTAGIQDAALRIGGQPGASPVTLLYNGSTWNSQGSLNVATCFNAATGTSNNANTTNLNSPFAQSYGMSENYDGTAWSVGSNLIVSRYAAAASSGGSTPLVFGGCILGSIVGSSEELASGDLICSL
jgi:hypothetical protein|tara:strand:+ start:961 stop:1959 length:999 start_codon:yes stop_codon:yes gene_type:complete